MGISRDESYHFPADNSVFYHQVLDQRSMNLAHVLMVVFLAHSRFAVCADGPAEEALCFDSHCVDSEIGVRLESKMEGQT